MWAVGTISFLLGVSSCLAMPILPPLLKTLMICFAFGGIIWFIPKRWQSLPKLITIFLLGFGWTLLFATQIQQKQLATELIGKDVIVKGIIASIPEQSAGLKRFEFKVQTLQYQNKFFSNPGLIRLSWYDDQQKLIVGSTWQLTVRLKPAHGLANPGGFDQEKWLFAHHLRATGYVIPKANNYLLAKPHFWQDPFDQLRQQLDEKIKTSLPNHNYLGFIMALTVGIRDQITHAQWQDLRNTGTNHLMAIAGLHIGFLVGFIYAIVTRVWRYSERLCLWLPAKQAAASFALIIAFIYAGLAGFSLPTQRAIIMLAVYLGSVLLNRSVPVLRTLAIALVIILILDPLSALTESFWLSFVAVGAIIMGMNGRLGETSLWWRYGRVQWVISIGLIPLSLIFFQQLSLIGVIANFIAIPMVGFIILPLCLLGSLCLLISTTLGHWLLLFAAQLFTVFWPLISWLGQLPDWQWHGAIPNTIALLCIVFACLLWLAPKNFPARWVGVFGILPVLLPLKNSMNPNDFCLTVLDVGQGLATVIETQHHTLVFDTGAQLTPEYDMGEVVVVPYLRAKRINQIDKLVISHADNDHKGGMLSVLRNLPVKEIESSVANLVPGRTTSLCTAGKTWAWDGVTFTYLYPPDKIFENNDSSCVLKISNAHQSIMLTGDIEHKSEAYILNSMPGQLITDVLVAPHHGSRTSSTAKFVAATSPKIVVFATGYHNRYHFPNKVVVERYLKQGTTMYNTASCGAVTISLNGTSLKPICYRLEEPHFWSFYSS